MTFETKYAPTNLSEFVYPEPTAEAKIRLYIENKMDGHLLFHGKYGSGKTTLAKLLPLEIAQREDSSCKKVWYEHLAGHEVGIDALKKLKDQASLVHPQMPRQLIVVDEADMMSSKAMDAMKKVMDDAQRHCSFIFCTNQFDRIEGGIQSRCVSISFNKSDVAALVERARDILKLEQVTLPREKISNLVENSGGDFRKLLQALEAVCFAAKTADLV